MLQINHARGQSSVPWKSYKDVASCGSVTTRYGHAFALEALHTVIQCFRDSAFTRSSIGDVVCLVQCFTMWHLHSKHCTRSLNALETLHFSIRLPALCTLSSGVLCAALSFASKLFSRWQKCMVNQAPFAGQQQPVMVSYNRHEKISSSALPTLDLPNLPRLSHALPTLAQPFLEPPALVSPSLAFQHLRLSSSCSSSLRRL